MRTFASLLLVSLASVSLAQTDKFEVSAVRFPDAIIDLYSESVSYDLDITKPGVTKLTPGWFKLFGTPLNNPVLLPYTSNRTHLTLDYVYTNTTLNSITISGNLASQAYSQSGFPITGSQPQFADLFSSTAFAKKVEAIPSYAATWSAGIRTSATGGSKIYRTLDLPWDLESNVFYPNAFDSTKAFSIKRIEYLTQTADQATTDEEAADKICAALVSKELHLHSSGRTKGKLKRWGYLSGDFFAECNDLAELMSVQLCMLGVKSVPTLVFASTDANVSTPQTRNINGEDQYLLMDFNVAPTAGDPYPHWNAFEGVSNLVGSNGQPYRTYSVYPNWKADNQLGLYKVLPFKQYWITTSDELAPWEIRPEGAIGNVTFKIVAEEPKYSGN